MNKDLKKLSRVELLQLLADLSANYEALELENAKLRRMLSKQRLPRSTKVGSIAQAALAANGYFEAAQRSADDYLREIKHLRDELALSAGKPEASAPRQSGDARQAQLLAQRAREHAEQVVAKASAQADAILANAHAQAEQTIADANRESHAILAQANRRAKAAASSATAATAATASASADPALAGDDGIDGPARSKSPQTTAEIMKRGRHFRTSANIGQA